MRDEIIVAHHKYIELLKTKKNKTKLLSILTSSSPKLCRLILVTDNGSAIGAATLVLLDTSISFVSLWMRAIKAVLAFSSSSNLDCNLTCPASSYT